MQRLREELAKLVEREREKKPKLRLMKRDLRALVEAVKVAEEFKPSQHAKRVVFAKYGIIGSSRDQLLTAIFYDVMKRLGVIDKIVREVANVPSPLILDPWLRAALRVAVDLLVFHRLSRSSKHFLKWIVADFISSKTHPYVGMYYWQVFEKIESYKPKAESEVELLEYKYLLPAWFIEKMEKQLGRKEAEELFKALNEKPLLSVRVNTLKASVEEVVRELEREGKKPIVSKRVPTIVKFEGPYNFDKSRLYREGKIVIQEEASAVASILLDPKPGETVVDLCAAPGGKTTHMAELMENKGTIYAFDVDSTRIKRMKMLLKRMGITIVKIYQEDAREAPKILGKNFADKVIVDAPCTSTGTIAKNPELRWRIQPDKLGEIVDLQKSILEAGVKLLKPGGRLLYCTCSVFVEEGEEVVKWVLKKYPRIKLVELKKPYEPSRWLPGTMRAWPHKHDTIGFFYALLEKKS